MRKKSKKAIEMQVNFIVMLILAIVVFSLGSMVAIKIFSKTSDLKEKLDEKMKRDILTILSKSDEKVVIPINIGTIPRGKHAVFGVGIKNKGDTSYFTFECTLSVAADKDNNEIQCADCDKWIVFPVQKGKKYKIKLKKFDNDVDSINVFVPKNAKSGTYAFNVQVKKCTDDNCEQTENYAALKKIYVKVP